MKLPRIDYDFDISSDFGHNSAGVIGNNPGRPSKSKQSLPDRTYERKSQKTKEAARDFPLLLIQAKGMKPKTPEGEKKKTMEEMKKLRKVFKIPPFQGEKDVITEPGYL